MTEIQSATRARDAHARDDGRAPDIAGTTVITKRFGFESAHYLPHVPEDHKCRRIHGHSYQVWLHVGGVMDRRMGWIVDFGDIKAAWKALEQRLDHRLLNDVDGLDNPTAENLASWIWQQMESARLRKAVTFRVSAVEVAETVDSKAMFVAPGQMTWVPGHRHALLPSDSHPQKAIPVAEGNRASTPPVIPLEVADSIEDVQARPDTRGVALDEVGVNRVRMPIEVLDRARTRQSTVAQVSIGVDLPAEVKGTHLSRFMEALREHRDAFTLFSLSELTSDVRNRVDGTQVRVRVEFPYFITKAAPVSGQLGDLDVDCAFEVVDRAGIPAHWLEVTTPVTTVCPCSRDISDYGAHNQRGHVTVRIRCANDDADLPALVWIEELVEVAESAASSPVYPVVKRPDERHITMAAYDRPRFVEDVARDVAIAVKDDPRIAAYEITVVNDESIHSHNAFARVSG